jgi:hypothetical protein
MTRLSWPGDSGGTAQTRKGEEMSDYLHERLAQVRDTDAYSRPRWTLADVAAVDELWRAYVEAVDIARKAADVAATGETALKLLMAGR